MVLGILSGSRWFWVAQGCSKWERVINWDKRSYTKKGDHRGRAPNFPYGAVGRILCHRALGTWILPRGPRFEPQANSKSIGTEKRRTQGARARSARAPWGAPWGSNLGPLGKIQAPGARWHKSLPTAPYGNFCARARWSTVINSQLPHDKNMFSYDFLTP